MIPNTITGCLILAAILILTAALARLTPVMRYLRRACGLSAGVLVINSLTSGQHPRGVLSLRTDAAVATKFLLGKRGSDAAHVAVVSAASDQPLGLMIDEAEADEYPMAVQLLGTGADTLVGVAGEDIAADVDVYSKGDGALMDMPAVTGTFWRVGRSVEAATNGLPIEFAPCFPQKVVIVANAANLATTQAAMAGGAIVQVLGA